MSDALDILRSSAPSGSDATTSLFSKPVKTKKKSIEAQQALKRPEGVNRELYALLCGDGNGPPLIPTDFTPGQSQTGYKEKKAMFGIRQKPRPWKWTSFLNPSRNDTLQLSHWRRIGEEKKDYPFARFNKTLDLVNYTDEEYRRYIDVTSDAWTKEETDHLFDLCGLFDMRFIIVHDRWDRKRFPTPRSIEDLKDRYYSVHNILAKVRSPPGHEPKLIHFDADHERRRKEQLIKLYNRSQDEIDEERDLLNELRKIEQRKKEREKKTQDLQKLISAADTQSEMRRQEQEAKLMGRQSSVAGASGAGPTAARPGRKKANAGRASLPGGGTVTPTSAELLASNTGIKFNEFRASGVYLRTQHMKLPSSVGQKKAKAIDQLLLELNVDLHPMPTEEICNQFNELRSDLVLLYELKMALASCEFEMQSLKHQLDVIQPGNKVTLPAGFHMPAIVPQPSQPVASTQSNDSTPSRTLETTPISASMTPSTPNRPGSISEVLELSGSPPLRKRRAATLEKQTEFLKKIKKV